MLLALTSASRASETCNLNISYMKKQTLWYSFTLSKPTKLKKAGNPLRAIKYFKLSENEKLCVCKTLDVYLDRISLWRNGEQQQLFLEIVSP